MIPREEDLTTKQEINTKPSSSTTSTTSWSRFKDPRIVRVSKAFGGKDRHSKVCTVRGLRDRRVRLSVPTAIQLYDLQDRLGLNQPSKVVDWLLNAAKNDIDELPPLQIPQGSFNPLSVSHEFIASQSDKQDLKISGSFNWNDPLKSKVVSGETSNNRDIDSWTRSDHDQEQNPTSFPSLLCNNTQYNSFVRWDPSNLTLCHPPRSLGFTNQNEDLNNFSLLQLPSGSHQVLVYQPGSNTRPFFPSQISPTNIGFDVQKLQPNFNSSQLLNSPSNSQPVRPFHFSMTANLLPSQNEQQ